MSTYPNQIDNFTNPLANDTLDSATVPHHLQHANANDAIEAIETELGVQPSGPYATVAERLTTIEGSLGNLVIDGGTF